MKSTRRLEYRFDHTKQIVQKHFKDPERKKITDNLENSSEKDSNTIIALLFRNWVDRAWSQYMHCASSTNGLTLYQQCIQAADSFGFRLRQRLLIHSPSDPLDNSIFEIFFETDHAADLNERYRITKDWDQNSVVFFVKVARCHKYSKLLRASDSELNDANKEFKACLQECGLEHHYDRLKNLKNRASIQELLKIQEETSATKTEPAPGKATSPIRQVFTSFYAVMAYLFLAAIFAIASLVQELRENIRKPANRLKLNG